MWNDIEYTCTNYAQQHFPCPQVLEGVPTIPSTWYISSYAWLNVALDIWRSYITSKSARNHNISSPINAHNHATAGPDSSDRKLPKKLKKHLKHRRVVDVLQAPWKIGRRTCLASSTDLEWQTEMHSWRTNADTAKLSWKRKLLPQMPCTERELSSSTRINLKMIASRSSRSVLWRVIDSCPLCVKEEVTCSIPEAETRVTSHVLQWKEFHDVQRVNFRGPAGPFCKVCARSVHKNVGLPWWSRHLGPCCCLICAMKNDDMCGGRSHAFLATCVHEPAILVSETHGVSINGGTPIAGWFIRKNPIKMDDLMVPLFQETLIYPRWSWCEEHWGSPNRVKPLVNTLHHTCWEGSMTQLNAIWLHDLPEKVCKHPATREASWKTEMRSLYCLY